MNRTMLVQLNRWKSSLQICIWFCVFIILWCTRSYIVRYTPVWTFWIKQRTIAFCNTYAFLIFHSSFNSNRRCVAVSQGLSAGCTNCCCSWKGTLTKLLSRASALLCYFIIPCSLINIIYICIPCTVLKTKMSMKISYYFLFSVFLCGYGTMVWLVIVQNNSSGCSVWDSWTTSLFYSSYHFMHWFICLSLTCQINSSLYLKVLPVSWSVYVPVANY
jgi:hypothetical protein